MSFKYGKYVLTGIAALVLVFLVYNRLPLESSKTNQLLNQSEFHLNLDLQKTKATNYVLNESKNEITFMDKEVLVPKTKNSFSLIKGIYTGLNAEQYSNWSHRYAQYQVSFDRKGKAVDQSFLKELQKNLTNQIDQMNQIWKDHFMGHLSKKNIQQKMIR